MAVRRAAFWFGVMIGAALGYIAGISLPEERQQHLRDTLVRRGEEVLEKARTVSVEQARRLAEEARRRVPEGTPFNRPKGNGTTDTSDTSPSS